MLSSILEVPRGDFDRVASGLFAYLFGLINRQRFFEFVEDRALAKQVLAASRSSGYVLKDCKLFAHAHYVTRKEDKHPSPLAYSVTRKDANFLKRLDLKTDRFCYFTPEQFDRLIAKSLLTPDMRAHIGKLVSKKMTFLVSSYGVTKDDLASTLRNAALRALYQQYPRYESALHAKNICKTTIHNTAMNLIQYHTRGKRQMLRSVLGGGAFESVHVPMEAVFDMAAPKQDSTSILVLKDLAAIEDKIPARGQEFVKAAVGAYHEGLSVFIGEDNRDAVERMSYEQYLKTLRSYFNITEQQNDALFNSLKPYLRECL